MYFLEKKKKAENLRELRHHKNQILKGLRKTKLSKKIQDVINTTKGPSQTLTNSVFYSWGGKGARSSPYEDHEGKATQMSDNSYILRTGQQSLNESPSSPAFLMYNSHPSKVTFIQELSNLFSLEFRTGDKSFMGHCSSWKCEGMGSWVLYLVCISCFSLYHPAANSLNSPGTLLLVVHSRENYFLNTVFLGQLILLKCR